MPKQVMHIDRYRRWLLGGVRTQCGVVFHGAPKNAPMCPKCVKAAGWTYDKRRDHR